MADDLDLDWMQDSAGATTSPSIGGRYAVADIWLDPVVTGAEVDPHEFCTSCSAHMVRLTVSGLGDEGVAELPSILLCPDHFNPQQVVAEWRERVSKGRH